MYDTSFYHIVNIFKHFEVVILHVVDFISIRHFALRYEVFFLYFAFYHTKLPKPVSGYLFQHGVEVATVGQFRSTAGYVAQKLPSKLEIWYQVLVGEDRTSEPLMTFDR